MNPGITKRERKRKRERERMLREWTNFMYVHNKLHVSGGEERERE
jgi:hypothetical protein